MGGNVRNAIYLFLCLLLAASCARKPQYVVADQRLLDMCEAFTLLVHDAKHVEDAQYRSMRKATFQRYKNPEAMGNDLLDIMRETQRTLGNDTAKRADRKIWDTVLRMEGEMHKALDACQGQAEQAAYLQALFEKHKPLYDFLNSRNS